MFTHSALYRSWIGALVVIFPLAAFHSTAKGEITDFIVTNIEPAFGGAKFGRSGQYIKIEGVAKGVLDPNDPLNSVIVDLDKAPINDDGLVEYSVEVVIAKPERHGNGSLIYSVLNRGRKLDLYFFNWIPEIRFFTNSLVAEDIGDGLAMEEGFTFVWSAWDGGVQPGAGRMVADFPVAQIGGEPIVGRNFFATIGVRYYDYEYTGSGNPMGKPEDIDEINSLNALNPVIDKVWDGYLSLTYRY